MRSRRRYARRRLTTVERIRRRTLAPLLAAFGLLVQLGVVTPAYSRDGVVLHDAATVDAEREHIGTVALHLASLFIFASRIVASPLPPEEGGPYEYLRPRADLPMGMTFNTWSGMVEGTVYNTDYATNLPTTEVVLTDLGSRSANRSALNSAIATAAASGSGTRIILAAGADYGGSSTLPANNSSGWIYIEDPRVKAGTLTEGVRVTPADGTLMPKLYMTAINTPVFTAVAGVSRYRFVGLEFAFAPSGVSWHARTSSTQNCNDGFVRSGSINATDIVMDRCFVHGEHQWNCKRGLWMDGQRMAVIDSHIDRVIGLASSSDGQCIWVNNGAGPFKFNNNYTAQGHSGENIMTGGGFTSVEIADIEVQRNHFDYPYRAEFLAANDTTYQTKNLYELKLGMRTLLQGNVFTNYYSTNVGSQAFTINLKYEKQSAGVSSELGADHVVLLHNKLINCSTFIDIAKNPSGWSGAAKPLDNVDMINCAYYRPPAPHTLAARQWIMAIGPTCRGITLRHSSLSMTIDTSSAFGILSNGIAAIPSGSMTGHEYADNVIVMTAGNTAVNWWRNSAWAGDGLGLSGWNAAAGAGSFFTGNTVTRTTSLPAGNTSVASAAAGGIDPATLLLDANAPVKGTARDGRDPGCVFSLLDAATAGVI